MGGTSNTRLKWNSTYLVLVYEVKSKDKNLSLHILSMEKFLWVKADFLIHQIVGAASIRGAVTVGGNAPLTFGKDTGITKASTGMLVIWKNLRG